MVVPYHVLPWVALNDDFSPLLVGLDLQEEVIEIHLVH